MLRIVLRMLWMGYAYLGRPWGLVLLSCMLEILRQLLLAVVQVPTLQSSKGQLRWRRGNCYAFGSRPAALCKAVVARSIRSGWLQRLFLGPLGLFRWPLGGGFRGFRPRRVVYGELHRGIGGGRRVVGRWLGLVEGSRHNRGR